MRHLGDITKINWFEVEPVDCVTGGSPCQDLSVAGKRAGLAGERSGLYMEQIRCIKELRWRDIQSGRTGAMVRPRWMVWENVPGAFSSNGGKDFAAVLEEAVKIVEPQAPPIPVPDKGWPSAGCLSDVDGRWSIAWRVHDAQFWGVPQRRKRIALVCDFGGHTAPEILFERKGLRWDTAEGGTAREETARTVREGVEGTGGCLTGWDCQSKRIFSPDGICATLNSGDKEGGNITPCVFFIQGNGIDRADAAGCNGALVQTEKSGTLGTGNDQTIFAATPINLMVATRCKALGRGTGFGVGEPGDPANTISAAHSHGVFATAIPINDKATRWQGGGESRNHDGSGNGLGIGKDGDPSPTLTAGDRHGVMCGNQVPLTYGIGNGQAHEAMTMAQEVSQTLNTMHDKQAILYQPKSAMEENWAESKIKNAIRAGESKVSHAVICEDVSHTLRAKANCAYREDTETYPVQNMMVRRLTPLECERLQGYPDGWTDIGEWIDSKGKKHQTSDTSRYKALGNSIALPFWYWMMQNMAEYLPEKPTLGSLFDGIGGFPLCWERIHGKGTARWASEIEEFPMAVTKKRFGEG